VPPATSLPKRYPCANSVPSASSRDVPSLNGILRRGPATWHGVSPGRPDGRPKMDVGLNDTIREICENSLIPRRLAFSPRESAAKYGGSRLVGVQKRLSKCQLLLA
jgi:hypothetical protein